MKIIVEVELGNDAMQTYHDVALGIAESLRNLAELSGNRPRIKDGGPVRDGNGNSVGRWEVQS